MANRTKVCTKCGKRKLMEDFYNDCTKPGGKKSYCKRCAKESESERRKAAREFYPYKFPFGKANKPTAKENNSYEAVSREIAHYASYVADMFGLKITSLELSFSESGKAKKK